MKVKCGREELNLGSSDLIMYNGACYQIVTRKIHDGWDKYNPIIAKGKAEKMVKSGSLVEVKNEVKYGGMKLIYYKISPKAIGTTE